MNRRDKDLGGGSGNSAREGERSAWLIILSISALSLELGASESLMGSPDLLRDAPELIVSGVDCDL